MNAIATIEIDTYKQQDQQSIFERAKK
ncbi:unnamed protein product, partial [Rotaria sordida]